MPRRRKAPSKWRFLRGFLGGLPFLIIAIAAPTIMQIACTMPMMAAANVQCPEMPWELYVVPLCLFFGGTAFSAYRWWRDYPCGELYLDQA